MNRGPSEFKKAKDFKGTMGKLFSYMKEYKLKMGIVVVFAILGTSFSIVGPNILRKATNKLYEGVVAKMTRVPNAGIDFDYIGNILLIMLGLYVASLVFGAIQNFILTDVTQKISYGLRKQISEKINKLPLKYFDKNSYGDVLSRITNDIDTVSQSLTQSLSQILTSVTMVIGVLIMMLTISWQMTLVAMIVIPLSGAIISLIVKNSQRYFKEQQELLGAVNGTVEEQFSGHNIVKAFNRQETSKREFSKLTDELYGSSWKSQFLSGIMMPIMNFVGNVGYVAVVIAGGYFTIQKVIQVGDILAFIQYVRSFTQPISQLAQIANTLQSTAAAAERVFEFLEEEEEIKEVESGKSIENVKGNVEFKNVKFGYTEDKIIINDFSAKIAEGKKVAIVGPTGAGKTTIIKLLTRFYELNGGEILIDGTDITDFTRHDLRELFGIVLQDTWLYNGTIMENIRYGRLDATDEEVVEAAKVANADHFIRTLPGCYNMVISEEGDNVSQGQKQLLTIARAILADPKILILDESTSSVDTRTEILLQSAMDKLMEGRTSFVIAHRLSTIKNADIILVMKDGDIVEQGSHDELVAQGGFYANLYNSQFENRDE